MDERFHDAVREADVERASRQRDVVGRGRDPARVRMPAPAVLDDPTGDFRPEILPGESGSPQRAEEPAVPATELEHAEVREIREAPERREVRTLGVELSRHAGILARPGVRSDA